MRFILIVLPLLLMFQRAEGANDDAFYPGDALTRDGNSAFQMQNVLLNVDTIAGRFQQVVDSSTFSSLPSGGGKLMAISFRADAFHNVFWSALLQGVEIDLSTTTLTGATLNTEFSKNVGSDVQRFVIPTDKNGALNIPHGGFVTAFGVGFGVQSGVGFNYDPAKGNLLVDVRGLFNIKPPETFVAVLDGVKSPTPISLWSGSGDNGDSPFGTITGNGLVMDFSFVVVPEPAPAVLVSFGVIVLVSGRFLLRKRMAICDRVRDFS